MRKKIISSVLLALMIGSTLVGCNSKQSDTPNTDTTEVTSENENTTETITNTEYDIESDHSVQNITHILDSCASEKSNTENTILSETSLNMALSLLLEGAQPNSDSYNDLIKYLDNSNYSNDLLKIRTKNNAIINQYANNDYYKLLLANSIWSNNNIKLNDDYVSIIKSYYNGQATSLDFSDPNSADVINNWCAKHTNDCIKEIISSDTLVDQSNVLINALYFNGDWAKPFDEYSCEKDSFTNADGSITELTLMRGNSNVFYENNYAEAFMKYYNGDNIAFVGILPKNSGNFNVSDLDIDSLLKNPNYDYDVVYKIPSFKVDDTNLLKQSLSSNGLDSLFVDSNDFLGTLSVDYPVKVSDVIQKTYVDVNEKGTEAAAITSIQMEMTTALPDEPKQIKQIYLNQPFVFMIYDTVNHEVLFIGKINSL